MPLEREWIKYRNACYPTGCTKLQESECRQAFFAGIVTLFNLMDRAITQFPEEDDPTVARLMDKLRTEAHGVCHERSLELGSRN